MDPLQWMGAVRMRVQTADKNITIIHTSSVDQLTSCEVKQKINPSRHFNFKTIEKIHLLLSSHIKIQQHICLGLFCLQTVLDLCIFLSRFRRDNIFTGGSNIMDTCILAGSLKIKTSKWICFLQTHSLLLHKTFTDGLESRRLLVDYCDVFISCLDSQSDGTHSLQRIH